MATRQHISPDSLSRPRNNSYSHVIKVDNTVYIAGQVSLTPEGELVGKGDPEAQVRQVWHNLEAAVRSAGGSLQDIVMTTTFATSLDCFAAVRDVRNELYGRVNLPTSTAVVVSALANPDFLVQIDAIAVV